VIPKRRNRESAFIDAAIEVLIVLAVAGFLALMMWSKPVAPPKLQQLSWRWEGCWVTELGCAPWAAEGDCEWGDSDWICVV
jgi:hypothetical protein